MMVGAAQVEITPAGAVDLSGFASRTQPMTGVLDPIHVKALHLADGAEKLLWLHFDVLALSGDFVRRFREWAGAALGLRNVLLSATHTHAAPATVVLTGCGKPDGAWLESLFEKSKEAANIAIAHVKSGEMLFGQTEFELAIDRRGKPSAHVDSVLSAVGWKRADGSFIAALVNYPMHPVALGHVNRMVSADWCAGADAEIRRTLSGSPITLVTNGACGNLNPPERPVMPSQAHGYGQQIGKVACAEIEKTKAMRAEAHAPMRIASAHVQMPMDYLLPDEIDRIATMRLNEFENTDWARPFREAITVWRDTQKSLAATGAGRSIDIELFAIDLGPVVILAISGELFSRFTAILRQRIAKPLFVVGYANAVFGYIPTAEAYEEGGYEVDQAHFFYNSFRPQKGSLEMLADRAVQLIQSLS